MAHIVYLLLPALWIGLLAGVSFIAAPVKFLAPSLARPVALEVGRVTFAVWNNIEWFVLALLVPPLLFLDVGRFSTVATLALWMLLFIQSAILLPALSARAAAIRSGARLSRSPDHRSYVAIDFLKLCILLAMAWAQGTQIAARMAV
jgi:hypothetical protein